jgi:hypothetical protein
VTHGWHSAAATADHPTMRLHALTPTQKLSSWGDCAYDVTPRWGFVSRSSSCVQAHGPAKMQAYGDGSNQAHQTRHTNTLHSTKHVHMVCLKTCKTLSKPTWKVSRDTNLGMSAAPEKKASLPCGHTSPMARREWPCQNPQCPVPLHSRLPDIDTAQLAMTAAVTGCASAGQ